jgi:subtilisin-like proprotein convertase family protein
MSATYPVQCRFDSTHGSYLYFDVFCSQCLRPLFNLKWWHHAILLNVAILSIGLIISEYQNGWLPSLLISLLFTTYILILFRKSPTSRLISLLIFCLVFPPVFINTHGSLVNLNFTHINTLPKILAVFKVVWIHLTCATLFVTYTLVWIFECNNRKLNYLKSFPVLSLGWFLILVITYGLDARLHFLYESVTSVIKNQIFIREVLLFLSISYILILALTKAVNNKIEVPKTFFAPETPVEYWTEPAYARNAVQNFLLNILARPVYNIVLNVYRILTQILKAVANFIIFLLRLSYARIVDYSHELLKVIEATGKLFLQTSRQFLRYVAIPLLLIYGVSHLLLNLTNTLASHINGHLPVGGYTTAILLFLILNTVIFLLVWALEGDGFTETLQSILTTNTLLTLIIALYACVVSFELWPIAQWLPGSAFKSIGSFTKVVSVAIIIGLIVIFIKLNPQKIWAGVGAGAIFLLLGATWLMWPYPKIQSSPVTGSVAEQTLTPTPTSTPYEKTFSNTASINIPDRGAASPYPSTVLVSGISGTVSKLTVNINGLAHSAKGDLDIMLLGPNGQSIILMSDVSSSPSTITFDDDGGSMGSSQRITQSRNSNSNSNTIKPPRRDVFKPTNVDGSDSFPNLPTISSTGTSLSIFNGTDPNGTWRLYVFDDTGGDTGRMAGGWSLTFRLDPATNPLPRN